MRITKYDAQGVAIVADVEQIGYARSRDTGIEINFEHLLLVACEEPPVAVGLDECRVTVEKGIELPALIVELVAPEANFDIATELTYQIPRVAAGTVVVITETKAVDVIGRFGLIAIVCVKRLVKVVGRRERTQFTVKVLQKM